MAKMRKLSTLLRSVGACKDAMKWAKPYSTLQEAWNACPRADWMLWLCGVTGTHRDECVRMAFAFADHAVRVDAVAALRSAASAKDMPANHAEALRSHADALAALDPITSRDAAWAASDAAGAARAAAWAARDAARAANAAAEATSDAARSANAAALAASDAAGAARAAAWAARDAASAAAVRAEIPDVAAILAVLEGGAK